MRVFVTGATGFVGSAVVSDLMAAGHQVLGLARRAASAATLAALGVDVQRGELADDDALVAGARQCDGVIHTAFIHDFSTYEANAETDRRALEAMARALEGTGKPLVATSATGVLASATIGTEREAPKTRGHGRIRAVSENVLEAAERGVRVSVVRLAPSVHAAGDHGFVPALIAIARRTGIAAYVGDGANRWPAVHRLDAARLFRLALEKAPAGSRLHGVAEEGIAMRDIAGTIGAGLSVPVRSLAKEQARAHFGWMAGFMEMDNPTSSAITRDMLGWNPQQPDLLADMRESGYFS